VTIEEDPMVLKAIDAMPKAKSLLDNAKKMLVQRLNRQNLGNLQSVSATAACD
jgi:hypothetical protein